VASLDLWSHVAVRTSVAGELLNVLSGRKTKVKQLNSHLVIYEYVLWLNVSVNNTTFMNVFYCI